jgi:hypothetical protein
MTKPIDYLMNPKITWIVEDGPKFADRKATGTWGDWEFTISSNERGGWDVKINGIQAWTHMRTFDSTMGSVRDRLRDWAYMDQFKH